MSKTIMKLAGILTLLVLAAGCGPQVPTTRPAMPASVEGQLAFFGRKVVQTASLAVDTVGQIGPMARQLQVTVQIIETATTDVDRTKATEAARQILKNMQQLIVTGLVPIGDDISRQLLATVMGQLADLVMNVALLLPPPPVGPAK